MVDGPSCVIGQMHTLILAARRLVRSTATCICLPAHHSSAIMEGVLRWGADQIQDDQTPSMQAVKVSPERLALEVLLSKRRTGHVRRFATLPRSHNAGSSPSLCQPALRFYTTTRLQVAILQQKMLHVRRFVVFLGTFFMKTFFMPTGLLPFHKSPSHMNSKFCVFASQP